MRMPVGGQLVNQSACRRPGIRSPGLRAIPRANFYGDGNCLLAVGVDSGPMGEYIRLGRNNSPTAPTGRDDAGTSEGADAAREPDHGNPASPSAGDDRGDAG